MAFTLGITHGSTFILLWRIAAAIQKLSIIIISVTLTLMQGHSGLAEDNKISVQLSVSTTKPRKQ